MKPFTKTPMFSAPQTTVEWLKALVWKLETTFRDIADMPFNKSATATVADTGTADTQFSVVHHLGRVPAGFLVTNASKAACVYKSGTAWTVTTIYLKCNAANANIDLLIY
jgi:hypothetical protein